VPGGSGGGIPGNGGCTGLDFGFFPGRGLAIRSHGRSLAKPREHTDWTGVNLACFAVLVLTPLACRGCSG